jgi:hypothetical protein
VLGADEAGDDPVENLCWIHEWLRLLVIFERAGARTGGRDTGVTVYSNCLDARAPNGEHGR